MDLGKLLDWVNRINLVPNQKIIPRGGVRVPLLKVSQGPLIWRGSAINRVFSNVDSLSRMFLCPRKACHVHLTSSRPRQYEIGLSSGPSYLSIARLGFCYLFVIPSSFEVTYASMTFPCIGRNGFAFLYLNCQSYEGGGEQAEQGDFVSGEHGVGIQLVDVVAETIVKDVAPTQPKRQKKQKTKVVDNGEPSHPTKKLKDDHGAPSGPTVGDSSDHSCVNITKYEVDSVVKTSVPTITSATTTTPTADPATISKEKFIGSSIFGADSLSAGESHPIPGGFFNCTGSDFLIGGIHTVIDPDSNLQKVYVPQWNVTNGSCLTMVVSVISLSVKVRMRADYNIREMRRLNSVIEEKDALIKHKNKEIRNLKAQLSDVAALKERNNLMEIEKSRLDVKVDNLAASVKVREQEVADLDDVVTSIKLQNDNFVDQLEAYSAGLQEKIMAYENCLSQLENFQDDRMMKMNDKFDKLDTDLVEMALHLEKRFYPHLWPIIFRCRWLLTHGLELSIAKCLNSTEYLSTLRAAIGKAIEKGMQDGVSAGITHGVEGTKSTLNVIPATVDTTMALSITSVSASLIPPISTDDYEITYAEGEKSVGANASPFPDVYDTKLKIP
nr:hypothetical protein [Tanacetum cinerariifolium]